MLFWMSSCSLSVHCSWSKQLSVAGGEERGKKRGRDETEGSTHEQCSQENSGSGKASSKEGSSDGRDMEEEKSDESGSTGSGTFATHTAGGTGNGVPLTYPNNHEAPCTTGRFNVCVYNTSNNKTQPSFDKAVRWDDGPLQLPEEDSIGSISYGLIVERVREKCSAGTDLELHDLWGKDNWLYGRAAGKKGYMAFEKKDDLTLQAELWERGRYKMVKAHEGNPYPVVKYALVDLLVTVRTKGTKGKNWGKKKEDEKLASREVMTKLEW